MPSPETVVREVRVADDSHELRASLSLPGEPTRDIWIRGANFPLVADCSDALVLGALLPAMARGHPLRIEGPVTDRLLASLYDWQQAWQAWRPNRYRAVDIRPDEVQSGLQRSAGSLATLSGGVDSLFTLVSDRYEQRPRSRDPISQVIFVHGQDIPLARTAAFAAATAKVATTAAALDAQLLVASTNIRSFLPSIEDGHGLLLASVMAAASSHAGTGVLAASYSLEENQFDWGSNPVTDSLLSSGRMDIVHDGVHVSRLQKLDYLAATRPDLLERLIVCPHLTAQGENCCVCEKCARTWMSMRAVGIDNPGCFPVEPSLDGLAPVEDALRPIWRMIEATARERGRTDVALMARRLLRRRPPVNARLRSAAKRLPYARSTYHQVSRYAGK